MSVVSWGAPLYSTLIFSSLGMAASWRACSALKRRDLSALTSALREAGADREAVSARRKTGWLAEK